MSRSALAVVVLATTLGIRAVETNAYYTVTVDGGTYDAPVSLDSLDVTVERDGATIGVKPFSEGYADFASGPAIFRKRGAGWMMSSTKMAEFTGEIRVEAGAFMVNTNLMTGPLDLATAPTVVVSNGASFALAATKKTCPSDGGKLGPNLHLMNNFSLAGDGVDGYGAIANFLGNTQYYLFYGDWSLLGDTTLAGRSAQRYDFYTLGEYPSVYLNGHTLTVRRGGGNAPSWTLCLALARMCNGNIVVNNSELLVQGGGQASRWQGDGTLTLTNNATLLFYNNFVPIPWRVKFCDGTVFSSGGNVEDRCHSDVGYTNQCNFLSGPIDIDGNVRFVGRYGYAGFTSQREMSGKGPLAVTAGWLNLVTPNPDYLGPIYMDHQVAYGSSRFPTGLALYAPGAYDVNAAGASLTNAEVRLMTDDRYDLPPLDFNISSGTNYSFSGGGYSNTCVSLKKHGDGTLDLMSNLSVTGRFELVGGTLRLKPMKRYYSLMGGLWKCMVPQGDTETYHAFMNDSSYYSNEVVNCCDMLKTPSYPPWEKYTSVAWGGYIWNRSPTNETRRFAVGICGYSRLWLDGVLKQTSDNNGAVYFLNVDMTPGCHEFLFKVNPRRYPHPGSISAQPTANKDWKSGYLGLALCRTSLTSTNSDDFVFIEDFCSYTNVSAGGTGYLFTRDARDVGEFDPEELERLTALERPCSGIVCNPGTTIDLGDGNETPFVVGDLEGVTTVVNGGLTIRDSWTLSPDYVKGDGATLSVSGALTFKDGCVLDWADLSLLPRSSDYVLAVASGGISGVPTWKPESGTHGCWRLAKEKDAEGRDTLTFRWRAGTVVILR